MTFTKDHVSMHNNYVQVKGIGTVALWWPYYDKKVCVDYSIGESFVAKTETEVIDGILKIINGNISNSTGTTSTKTI